MGLAVVLRYGDQYEWMVIVGSLIAFVRMILFAAVIFRNAAAAVA